MSAEHTLAEPAHAKLRFEPDDMHNASVFLDEQQVYTIKSASDLTSTEVFDGQGKRVVKIVYHTIRADTIQWHDHEETKLKGWLPNQKDYPVSLAAANGQHLVFNFDSSRRLAAYMDGSSSPLAWYVRGTAESPAYLAFSPDAEAMQDEILVAMLVLRSQLAAKSAAQQGVEEDGQNMTKLFRNPV